MNKLSFERQSQIIKVLCEGNSIRSTARITDSSANTVIKLLREVGAACLAHQDKTMRNLSLNKLKIDEIWSFVYFKNDNVPENRKVQFGVGDVWTFTAVDAETQLVPAFLIGQRNANCASSFIGVLKNRLANRVQLTTSDYKMYLEAVEKNFASEINYAMLVKLYGAEPEAEKRNGPSERTGAVKPVIQGNPDIKAVSTGNIERHNLSMRMGMTRFVGLINALSKRLENHIYALGLYFMHYNFARTHKTLANPYPRTPAMAAGISDHIWTIEEIVRLTNKS